MSSFTSAQKIPKNIIMFSVICIILIKLIIMAAVLVPAYQSMQSEMRQDIFLLQSEMKLLIRNFLDNVKASTLITSSNINFNNLTSSQLQNILDKQQINYKNKSDLVGIKIQRNDDKRTIKSGVIFNFPDDSVKMTGVHDDMQFMLKSIKDHLFIQAMFKKKYRDDNQTYIIQMNYDITDVLNKVGELSPKEYTDIFLIYKNKPKLEIFPLHHSDKSNLTQAEKTKLINLNQQDDNSTRHQIQNQNQYLFNFTEFPSINAQLLILMNQKQYMQSLYNSIYLVLLMFVIVIIVFTIGLFIFIRPLAGRLIFHEQALKKTIQSERAELKKANKKLRHLVGHDYLTNVKNRRGFNQELEAEVSRARRHHSTFLIFYIDLDKFKAINDEISHEAGDTYLKAFAKKLQSQMRKEDVIGRIGGDEFIILTPNLSKKNVKDIIQKIKNLVEEPVQYGKKKLKCGVSVGYAAYPDDGTDIESLLKKSDKRMYKDKKDN